MSAALELSTLLRRLPSFYRDRGIMVAIRRAYDYGYADPLWSKREAVRLATRANMEAAVARGKGYAAGRRTTEIGRQVERSLLAMQRRMERARQEEAWKRRVERERARRHADVLAEEIREARAVGHHYRVAVNE